MPNYLTLAETRAQGGANNGQVIEFCVFLFCFFSFCVCNLRTLAPALTWHLRSADRSHRCSNPRARYLMMFLRFRTTFLCYCYCFCCCYCCRVCPMPCCMQRDALVALEKSGHSYVVVAAAGLTFCFLSFSLLTLRSSSSGPWAVVNEFRVQLYDFCLCYFVSLLFFCLLDFVYINMVNRC